MLTVSSSEAKGMAQKIQDGSAEKGLAAYSHILEVLLRLRQVCCHWKLTGDRVINLLDILNKDGAVALTNENRAALQTLLQISIDSQEECSICLDTLYVRLIFILFCYVFLAEEELRRYVKKALTTALPPTHLSASFTRIK
jgi:hypothetical protein